MIIKSLEKDAGGLIRRAEKNNTRTTKKTIRKTNKLDIKLLENIRIPINIYSNGHTPLRATVTYLKDYLDLSFSQIALILNRSYRSIWGAYEPPLIIPPSKTTKNNHEIPVNEFTKEFSILETVVKYLRENNHSYSAIAKMLNKDQRTIWTINKRANEKSKKKNGQKKSKKTIERTK